MPEMTIGGLTVESLSLVYQWGLAPASGTVTAVGDGGAKEGDEISFSVGGFSFAGIATSVVQQIDDGRKWTISLVDFREKLKDDTVYGFFNKVEIIEDDWTTPGIDRKKRYYHLYPSDWDTYTLTWTDTPHTAKEILTRVFTADTVRHTWSLEDHDRLALKVAEIDFETGKEIGVVLQEVLDKCGLLVTITGESNLRFAVQGEGDIPPFPLNSRSRSIGQALAEAPTKLRVVGDRNLYQLFHTRLVPDWVRAWEPWMGELQWLEKIEEWYGPYGETKAGLAKRAADARTVTVRQVVEQAGAEYADYGLWGEVSRMEIPAWIYLQDVLFKAYRLPRDLTIHATPLKSTELHEGLLVPVTYDATTGKHARDTSTADLYTSTKAFVTVQGQPLDVWDPTRAGEFEPNLLAEARTRWQANQRFALDTRNYGILFEEATFRDGEGDASLLTFPNADISDIDDDLRYLAVPNANVEIEPANCYGTFVFAAEIYAKTFGSGRRADTVHQSGLGRHLTSRDNTVEEIAYADEETADQKATELAEQLLDRRQAILSGGFTRVGAAGTTLTGAISQVTVGVTFGDGLTEVVQFSNDAQNLVWDSDRELERKRRAAELFPGQERLREEARQLRETSLHYKAASRANQRHYQNVADVQMRPTTNREPNPQIIRRPTAEAILRAGDVLWKEETSGEIGAAGSQFVGVVIPSTVTGRDVPVARQGLVPVRVTGPCEAGQAVGCDADSTVARVGGERHVGRVQRTYGGSETLLMPVALAAPGNYLLRQFTLAPAPGGKVKIYYGTVTGIGFSGVPTGLTDGDWTEFPLSTATDYYLRVEFDPSSEAYVIWDGAGNDTTVYKLASGGTGALVSIESVAAAADPGGSSPAVNPETGAVEEAGIYFFRIGRATPGVTTQVSNDVYGPLGIGYCAPDTLKVWEILNREA